MVFYAYISAVRMIWLRRDRTDPYDFFATSGTSVGIFIKPKRVVSDHVEVGWLHIMDFDAKMKVYVRFCYYFSLHDIFLAIYYIIDPLIKIRANTGVFALLWAAYWPVKVNILLLGCWYWVWSSIAHSMSYWVNSSEYVYDFI